MVRLLHATPSNFELTAQFTVLRDVRTGHGEDLERVLTSQGLPLVAKCHDVVAVEAGVRAEVVALMGIEGRADRPDLGQWGQGGATTGRQRSPRPSP